MIRIQSAPPRNDSWPRLALLHKPRRMPRAAYPGFFLIAGSTLWLILWLGYRLVLRPTWLGSLPDILQELVSLTEIAGIATLFLIWGGFAWRQLRRETSPGPALSIASLYSLSPDAFERFVAGLFRQKGYHVIVRGGTGDHGVDLEVTNPQGKSAIVQCKRYQSKVGEDVVRELYGTLIHEKAAHAFLVTTAAISRSARDWSRGKPITLIDGDTLVKIALALREQMRGAQ